MSSDLFRVQEHVVAGQHIREYPGATRNSQEDVLNLHVKQYTPLDVGPLGSSAVTIISAHANGFPKELYEPLWDELLKRSRTNGFSIRGIWIADVVHQGTSGVLNEDKLGYDPSWIDHSRDLLHIINVFHDQMPRPIVGIGHSFGGNQLINLSLFHPRLFTTLILLDPVIQRQGIHRHDKPSIAQISTFRRDLWPSRAAAAASLNKSPFYKRWDKRVLDRWLQYGLRELPTPVYPEIPFQSNTTDIPVTLKTTKHQEVWTFVRPAYDLKDYNSINRKTHPDIPLDQFEPNLNHPFYRPEVTTTFHKLPYVRPSVLYILGETSDMSLPELRKDKLENTGIGYGGNGGVKEGRVKEVVLKDVGHLVPMEDVEGTAEHTAEWLGVELKRWREDEREWEEARKRRDPRHDIVVNDEWLRRMGQGMTVKPKM